MNTLFYTDAIGKRTLTFETGQTVLEVLRNHQLEVNAPCNGHGTCGKCNVLIDGEVKLSCSVEAKTGLNIAPLFSSMTSTISYTPCFIPTSHEIGVAIDIGTTGISYALYDMNTQAVVHTYHTLNQQIQYGADVFTRIAHSLIDNNGADSLKRTIRNQLNTDLQALLIHQNQTQIKHIVISANTTMCYLLLGYNTVSLSKYPYQPEELRFSVHDLQLDSFPLSKITLIPCASAFIGGDIVSGLSTLNNSSKTTELFLDLGTNGELVLLKNQTLYGTSTAVGPAFEGMNISCGSKAEPGAIDRFWFEDDEKKHTTIGNQSAKSICGSGLLETITTLIENHLVQPNGRFCKTIGKRFELCENIYLTQKDIRQVQLAKGAVLAGILALLKETQTPIDSVETLYIAGNFGAHISESLMRTLGFIPSDFNGNVVFVGNTSLHGAVQLIASEDTHDDLVQLSQSITAIELSTLDYFQTLFIEALNFPDKN